MSDQNATTPESNGKGNGLANFLASNPHISATELAKDLGISPGFISQVRNGKRDLPISNALKLEIIYGADAAELNKEIAEIRKLKPKHREKGLGNEQVK